MIGCTCDDCRPELSGRCWGEPKGALRCVPRSAALVAHAITYGSASINTRCRPVMAGHCEGSMTPRQIVLLSLCNDASRGSRMSGGPRFDLTTEPNPRAIVAWLRWNDRNGDYPADCDSLDDAWEWLDTAMSDELTPYAWHPACRS